MLNSNFLTDITLEYHISGTFIDKNSTYGFQIICCLHLEFLTGNDLQECAEPGALLCSYKRCTTKGPDFQLESWRFGSSFSYKFRATTEAGKVLSPRPRRVVPGMTFAVIDSPYT